MIKINKNDYFLKIPFKRCACNLVKYSTKTVWEAANYIHTYVQGETWSLSILNDFKLSQDNATEVFSNWHLQKILFKKRWPSWDRTNWDKEQDTGTKPRSQILGKDQLLFPVWNI